MKIITYTLVSIGLFIAHLLAHANASQSHLSLQRGAQVFMGYCSGCHSLKYLRYNQMATDLRLKSPNYVPPYKPIQTAMPAQDAKHWFGVVPPDLSLSARQRGKEWLYRYLSGFYNDKSRPFGVNNLVVPNVAMPNVLAPLVDKHDLQSDEALTDVVNFLVYVGEPAQLIRYKLGYFVLTFFSILLLMTHLLSRISNSKK